MSDFSGPSWRRFIATAGTASEAILFKGCGESPPSPASLSSCAEAMTLTPATTPEIITTKLGYLAIAESVPLIMTREKSRFDRHGLTGVDPSKPAPWGAAGDNLIAEEVMAIGRHKPPMVSVA